MKTILVPTDFSETAEKALNAAVHIGGFQQTDLVLMHTSLPTEGVNSNVYAAIYIHEYLETKRKNLNLLADKVRETGYKGKIKTDNKVDFTVPSIVNAAEEFDADLVVMGSTGSSGLAGVFLGSIAGGVLSKIERPLFLITKDFALPEGGDLLIGTDYKTRPDKNSLEILRFFKEQLNFSLNLVHISHGDEVSINKEAFVNNHFDGMIDSHVDVPGAKVEGALMKIKEKYQNAVLCTITRKRSWFESLFSHSVSRSLTHYSDIPLLCLQSE
ncbi:MAG: universal stress protein [Saprospiraceae bacterium]|nr:MAG: UspA domain-containing protein [Candidatus Parvibacillus calidus]MCC7149885.1 universal stress protein [Saprospiraceae bacterium]WKZ62312.1 MAG: universal stress protein [Saprospiraceae bacterium]